MLMITGQIDAVELISVPNVYCKYSFVYGLDWKQVAGSEEGRMWCHPNQVKIGEDLGISATGYKPSSGYKIVLNTPIEATFSFTNPFKCNLLFEEFRKTYIFQGLKQCSVSMGKMRQEMMLCAVIVLHICPQCLAGLANFICFFFQFILRTKRRCPIFLPQASTAIQRLMGFFTGRRAEFIDPRIMAMAESRDGLLMNSQ